MGNYEHSANVHHLFKRVLNKKLGFGIDICRCLVENHYRRLMHYGSGKGEKLTLALGEVISSLTNLLVKSCRELVYKVSCVDVIAGLHNLLVGYGLVAKDDIRTNRAREEEYVLEHLSEVTAKR